MRHRASFLDAGHFKAVADNIAQHLHSSAVETLPHPWCVLDAGSGTGHHLARIVDKLRAPAVGLGLDLSTAAARHAARRWSKHAFAVADLWRDWPVRDRAADFVLSIFAPKNFPENARVLRPGGWFALVYPSPAHLVELSRRFSLMRPHVQKDERYAEAVDRFIGPPRLIRQRSLAVLDAAAVRDLLLMGPDARHLSPLAFDAAADPLAVTIDIVILLARKSRR